jgi:hypothetical protein
VISNTAIGATSVHTSDLDRDGDYDVLFTTLTNNRVSWAANLGNGLFGAPTVITQLVDWPQNVTTADLDLDGDADVLTASHGDDKIAWYENTENGSGIVGFGPQRVISTDADGAKHVSTADLDGDGDLDVLAASDLDDKIAWYENQGGGNFGLEELISLTEDGARCVEGEDLDRDGDIDLLAAAFHAGTVTWYENLGGSFSAHLISSDALRANDVFAADLDGDGFADVLSASRLDNKVAWYPNTGGCVPPTHFCQTSPNTVGPGALIGNIGSTSHSANDFVLTGSFAPANQTGIFYYGSVSISEPFGEGIRCIGGTTFRLIPVSILPSGRASFALDLNQPPANSPPGEITPGSTWLFQFWYRDPTGGPAGFNFTGGLEVRFCP